MVLLNKLKINWYIISRDKTIARERWQVSLVRPMGMKSDDTNFPAAAVAVGG